MRARRFVVAGFLAASSALAVGACGGQAVEDEGSGGAASGGSSAGGVPSSGGQSETGGAAESGGAPATGGQGAADNGCNLDTIVCPEGSPTCECPGVFEDCTWNSIHCDADEDREPRNCTCGEPDVLPDDCEYRIQHRCEPPLDMWPLTNTCTCDPALPSDDEPCRYFQAMYDEAGIDRTCTMLTSAIEPEEKYKYTCSCTPEP